MNKMNTEEKIREYLSRSEDWRSGTLQDWRKLIHQACPQVQEEWKWNSPVFSWKGKLVCSLGRFKTHVALTFFQGALLKDPSGLFASDSAAKKMRSLKVREGDPWEEKELALLLDQAFSL